MVSHPRSNRNGFAGFLTGVRPRRIRRHGIALLDVLVSGIVLSISLVAIFGLASNAMKSQMLGERRLRAAMFLDELLNMVLAVGPEEYPSSFATSGQGESPFEEYEYDVIIEDLGIGRPYRVTANVYWTVGQREYAASIETRIAPKLGDIEEGERIPDRPVLRP